jgi:hypothetical protein
VSALAKCGPHRRLLLDLDDRMLLDIGLSRSDVLFPPRAIGSWPAVQPKLTRSRQ